MLPFDCAHAERCLVQIVGAGMDARLALQGRYVATACHCLPRVNGKIRWPDPDLPGDDPVVVPLRAWRGEGLPAKLVVVAADPCSDLALLGDRTESGMDLPVEYLTPLDGVEPACVEATPHDAWEEFPIFICTHEGRWLTAVAQGRSIVLAVSEERVLGRTSGAPVFNAEGRVVGVVSTANLDRNEATMALLADSLPSWALRMAREDAGAE